MQDPPVDRRRADALEQWFAAYARDLPLDVQRAILRHTLEALGALPKAAVVDAALTALIGDTGDASEHAALLDDELRPLLEALGGIR